MRTLTTTSAKPRHYMLQASNGIMGVIQQNVPYRGTLAAAAREMIDGRMAMALREDRTKALQLALLDAHRRQRLNPN